MTRIVKVVAEGLRYSARTTAMREGLPWDGECRASSMGLIRGLEAGASGGVAGKGPRHQ
ncbi:MAG: hypothetical protein ACT4UP_01320 [Gammaproteobacteria bacterium]